uniref:NB-ARC domain-containing protein n=1 Tax=Leersia perrieri TaxID=77586 RepID=A0A0D9WTU9_9ORYZ
MRLEKGISGVMDVALTSASSSLAELAVEFSWIILLKEDFRVIRSGGGHKITLAKHDLQELENYIHKASFFLAGTGTMNSHKWRALRTWISDAQKAASCLEDQIAIYAMRGAHVGQLHAMKSAIGMFSIKRLMKNIRDLINDMPNEVQSSNEEMGRLPAIRPFTRGEQLSGRTTLMNKVYETTKVKDSFKLRCKVDMSKTRCLADLLRAMLKLEERSANSMDPDSIDELKLIEEVRCTYGQCTHGMNIQYLVVMDDFEDTSSLDVLRHVLQDYVGRIVCLTKIRNIQYKEPHANVEVLPLAQVDQCKLLVHVAFRNADGTPATTGKDKDNNNNNGGLQGGGDDLLVAALQWKTRTDSTDADELMPMVEMLNGILKKCRGNPWNIWTVGALLAANPIGKWKEIEEKQVDDLVIGDKKHDPLIEEEYARLPAEIRLGFLYCLAFPESSEIPENSLIPARKLVRMWTAEGFPPHDSPRQSQEQEAEELLHKLIDENLLVVEKRGLDGEVLKCRVNRHMRPLALEICEAQKFCRFVPDPSDPPQSPALPGSSLFRRKTTPSHRYRVLAVHGDQGFPYISSAMSKDIRLRSLLYFRTGRKEPPKLELSFGRTYKLLRTLELQGTRLTRLPSSIACLVCLRYLGLRGTQLEYLPTTPLQNLRLLMCLDVRDTGITEVSDVSEFKEMRHLYLANSFRDQSVLIKEGLPSLLHLQTLSGAAHEVSAQRKNAGMIPFEQELLYLKLLRKLSVKKASSASSKDICDAINKLYLLQSLTITCAESSAADGQAQFDLSHLKINNKLRKLKLGGPMGQFHTLIQQTRMQSITYLYLWDSNLQLQQDEDPLKLLQGLQHLLLLSLYNVYDGVKLTCSNGYHKLKKLSIISMENLSECTFSTESMANLEVLVFAKCAQLKSPPTEIEQLGSLKEVHLAQMHQEFCNGMEKKVYGRVYYSDLQKHFHSSTRQGGN